MNPRILSAILAWFIIAITSPLSLGQTSTTDYWEVLPVFPKPLQAFQVGFRETRVSGSQRIKRVLTLQMSAGLVGAYLGVSVPLGLKNRLSASSALLGGGQVRITITDLQHPDYVDPPGGQTLFLLKFSGLPATPQSQSISIASVQNYNLLNQPLPTIRADRSDSAWTP